MRLVLTGRNVEITPTLRGLIERRLTKLERMLNDAVVSAQVVLALEKYRHITEITVHARGDHVLHGIGDAADWPLSLRAAVEKVGQQAHRLKSKWSARKKRPASRRSAAGGEREPRPEPPASGPRIIRAARYPVKPMTIEDAALAVETGREAFLVFRDAATDEVTILYRRKDGNLGLIEP
jgi:putative sigma-54 modulation protein